MKYSFFAEIHRFPGKGGWWYVRIPEDIKLKILPKLSVGRGWKFVKIIAEVRKVQWNTSILPLGKGQYFIAVKKSVRDPLGLMIGEGVKVKFKILEE